MTIFFVDAPSLDGHAGLSDGRSPASAFRGLDKVVALALSPGDIVALRAGAVFDLAAGARPLIIHARGGQNKFVLFTRYGAGDNPLIKAGGAVGVDVVDSSFVKLDCIDVEGGDRAGVRVDARSHYVRFENMDVSKSGFGFEVRGTDSLFAHNSVHDLRMIVNTPGGDDDYGAVAFAIQGNNNEFAFNRVWRAKAPSFDYGMDGGGFEFWKSVRGVSIHDNWVEDSAGFLEAGGEGVRDVLADIEIYNNVSYKNGLFQWIHNAPSVGKFGLTIEGLSVHHNTIVEPAAKEVIGFGGPVKAGSFTFAKNLVFAPQAKVFNQAGDYHFANYYEVATRQGGKDEAFGAIPFAHDSGKTFQVKRGEGAEFFGAYSLGGASVDASGASCNHGLP